MLPFPCHDLQRSFHSSWFCFRHRLCLGDHHWVIAMTALSLRRTLLAALLALPGTAFCQTMALPAPFPSDVFSTAVSALLSRLSKLGVASSDPRVVPTVSDAEAAISSAETSSADSLALPDSSTSALATSEALDISAFLGPEAVALTAAGVGVFSVASYLIPAAVVPIINAYDASVVSPPSSIQVSYPPVSSASSPSASSSSPPSSSASSPASSSSAPSSSSSAPSSSYPRTYPWPPLPTNAILFPASLGTVPFTFFTSPYGASSDIQVILAAFLSDISGVSISSVTYSSVTQEYDVTTNPSGYSFGISAVLMPYELPSVSTQLSVTDQPGSTDYYFVCDSGFYALGPSCVPAPAVVSAIPITYQVQDLPSSTPPPVLGAPLSPAIVAAVANSAWQKAASAPGYQGVPFSESSPVTAADVEAAEAASPATSPLVQDFVTPLPVSQLAPPASASSSPSSSSSSPSSSMTTQPLSLGADPGTPAPSVSAPAASSVLAPITSLLPDFLHFTLPSMSGTCPAPSFSMWGSTYTIDEQCALWAKYGPILHATMIAAFTLASVLVILTA